MSEISIKAANQILPITRVLAGIVVPVLFVAFVMLYLFPDNSGQLFAWPIKPRMSAMMLGATYLGGAYFFSRVIFARHWYTVKLGFLPVSTFAGILGITTLLHWDKFTPGHISFILWAILYFTLPLIIPVVWYINRRVNLDSPRPEESPFSRLLSLTIGGLGLVLSAVSLMMLLFPGLMAPTWTWTLSPLTTRVLSAMFALSGFVGLGVAVERRWSSARVIFQAQVISIVLILLAMFLNRGEILWSYWTSWFFVSGLLFEMAVIGWAYYESRRATLVPEASATD